VTGVEHWRHGEPERIEWPRRFALHRWYDLTGQSGTGIVAYGTVYPSGRTTLAWCCGDVSSVTVYDSPEQIERIHGHGGYTDLVWLDAETPSHTRNGEPERASVDHISSTSSTLSAILAATSPRDEPSVDSPARAASSGLSARRSS
jgi:hypothetical protein